MATKFAVIGAGHGGKSMAAHLALMGFTVTLYNRTMSHIEVIKKRGGIELDGDENVPHGFGKLALVTDQIGDAIKDMEVIMVVLPSSAHAEVAANIAPHLVDGQIIRSLPDMYRLGFTSLAGLERMADKSARNLLDALREVGLPWPKAAVEVAGATDGSDDVVERDRRLALDLGHADVQAPPNLLEQEKLTAVSDAGDSH
jgi:hypothetical protein